MEVVLKMKQLENYPDVLNVNDIQEILGIGRQQAYELVSSNKFYTVRIGRRIKIFKEVFIQWLRGELDVDQISTEKDLKTIHG